MRKLVGSGTFVSVERSTERKGKVVKRFKFPLLESTAKRLKADHDSYVRELRRTIPMPETVMEGERRDDGRYDVTITQDDLTGNGCSLSEFMNSDSSTVERVEAFGKAMGGTLQVSLRSKELEGVGIRLGLESNPNNWWITSDSKALFFDTTPPLISVGGSISTDVLVPRENPTFLGRLMAKLARMPIIRRLSERVIKSYAFDWPTTVRTFLIKSVACAPSMRDELVDATRKAVGALEIDERYRRQFQKKLTDFSIKVELMKLRAFDYLASIGQAKGS
jgi:hypothetical protein